MLHHHHQYHNRRATDLRSCYAFMNPLDDRYLPTILLSRRANPYYLGGGSFGPCTNEAS